MRETYGMHNSRIHNNRMRSDRVCKKLPNVVVIRFMLEKNIENGNIRRAANRKKAPQRAVRKNRLTLKARQT